MTTPASTSPAAPGAVEDRDLGRLHELYDPDLTFERPPGPPYSGRFDGGEVEEMSDRFQAVWGPLQPTADERSMQPVVIGSSDDTVVTQYQWRATHPTAGNFETRVLARYRVNAGRLVETGMSYWTMPVSSASSITPTEPASSDQRRVLRPIESARCIRTELAVFTGIVEELGTVVERDGSRLRIGCTEALEDVELGALSPSTAAASPSWPGAKAGGTPS